MDFERKFQAFPLTLLSLIVPLFLTTRLMAQETFVPRIHTFSGLVSPPLPYAKPEDVGLSEKKLNWIGDEIVSWITNGEIVGAELLVIKDEKAVFHEAYGWSDREKRIPVRRNSIWSIKSMSKPFTAMAVLMLVEEDKLFLEEPVINYILNFGGDKQTTIHHLLCHQSGFKGNHGESGNDENFDSLRDWVANWAKEGPTEPFGDFNYSDFNYAALGYIVEEVTGIPIDRFTEERIIRPLRLEDTTTGFADDPYWLARVNPWYRWNEQAKHYDLRYTNERQPWPYYAAAWGLFSTAMDYAKFMAMWMRKGEWNGVRRLNEESIELALQSHALTDPYFSYGYGWQIDEVESKDLRPFAHGGGDGTQSGAYPDDNAIVILLTHSRWGPWTDGFWNRIDISGVFENRLGYGMSGFMIAPEANRPPAFELSATDKVRYTGLYQVSDPHEDDSYTVLIWEQSGHLNFRLSQAGLESAEMFHLVPNGNDQFAIGRYDEGILEAIDPHISINFSSGDSKQANTLKIVEQGEVVLIARRNQ